MSSSSSLVDERQSKRPRQCCVVSASASTTLPEVFFPDCIWHRIKEYLFTLSATSFDTAQNKHAFQLLVSKYKTYTLAQQMSLPFFDLSFLSQQDPITHGITMSGSPCYGWPFSELSLPDGIISFAEVQQSYVIRDAKNREEYLHICHFKQEQGKCFVLETDITRENSCFENHKSYANSTDLNEPFIYSRCIEKWHACPAISDDSEWEEVTPDLFPQYSMHPGYLPINPSLPIYLYTSVIGKVFPPESYV